MVLQLKNAIAYRNVDYGKNIRTVRFKGKACNTTSISIYNNIQLQNIKNKYIVVVVRRSEIESYSSFDKIILSQEGLRSY